MNRVLHWGAVVGAILLIGGCANNNSSPLESLRGSRLLQNVARGVLTAKYSDQAAIATRNNDEVALQRANAALQKVAPQVAAERLVWEAVQFDSLSQGQKNKTRAAALRENAAQKYGAALRVAPNFDSRDPQLLNALGYFLAERGTTNADFKTAERLTRGSLDIWDGLVSQAENSYLPGAGNVLAQRRLGRANTRDSLAWALFRQGEYAAALKEQAGAIAEAEQSTPVIGEIVPSDLYYHLGEIYRALKKSVEAKTQYQKALQVEPDHELSQSALKELSTDKHR